MLENNEKNILKILYLLYLISFILNIKNDFDYLSFTSQYGNMALIFLCHFHGYNKNYIVFAGYCATGFMFISSTKKKD
jgi:hypothetical protein